jgi:hypothetical protein
MKALDKFIEIPSLPYILSGLIFICSLAFLHTNKEHNNNQLEIVKSLEFSHMMSQSSDDLTNNARYYASTKNPLWREQFENVLKVRSGDLPDKDGKRKSYVNRVKEYDFKSNELEIYETAVKLSDNLAVREVEAFKIIGDIREGKVKSSDELESKAIDLVFGREYQKYKSEIMETSDKFSKTVMKRLEDNDKILDKIEFGLITAINISLVILVMALKHKSDIQKKPVRKAVRKKPVTRRRTANA